MENIQTVDVAEQLIERSNQLKPGDQFTSGGIALEVLKQDETDIGAEGLSEEVTVH